MKIEELRTELLPLSKLTTNTGQIDGLPKNPRFIRNEMFEALKKSLQDEYVVKLNAGLEYHCHCDFEPLRDHGILERGIVCSDIAWEFTLRLTATTF